MAPDPLGPHRATESSGRLQAVAPLNHVDERVPIATLSSATPRTLADAGEAAISQVLDAERESRDAIAGAKVDAATAAEAARASARSLQARTERRILAVRAALQCRTQAELAVLDSRDAGPASPHQVTADESRHIDRAVAEVALALVGIEG